MPIPKLTIAVNTLTPALSRQFSWLTSQKWLQRCQAINEYYIMQPLENLRNDINQLLSPQVPMRYSKTPCMVWQPDCPSSTLVLSYWALWVWTTLIVVRPNRVSPNMLRGGLFDEAVTFEAYQTNFGIFLLPHSSCTILRTYQKFSNITTYSN